MIVYSSHLKPRAEPVLVREGWSWGAAFFGPFWLLWWRAWIPGLLLLALSIVAVIADRQLSTSALGFGMFLAQGAFGRDLVRWGLSRRGFVAGPVVAERNWDAAMARLFAKTPELRLSA